MNVLTRFTHLSFVCLTSHSNCGCIFENSSESLLLLTTVIYESLNSHNWHQWFAAICSQAPLVYRLYSHRFLHTRILCWPQTHLENRCHLYYDVDLLRWTDYSYTDTITIYGTTNINLYIIGLRDKMCHCHHHGCVCHIYVNAYITYIV